ncbi:MAG: hypothetical protein AABX11_02955 [Nanoarchaeota archaeon]
MDTDISYSQKSNLLQEVKDFLIYSPSLIVVPLSIAGVGVREGISNLNKKLVFKGLESLVPYEFNSLAQYLPVLV